MKHLRHAQNALLFSVTLFMLLIGCTGENPTAPELAPMQEAPALETSTAKQGGFIILETPETPGRPFYVGIIPVPELTTDEGEMLIPFFREPSCIPPDANLLGIDIASTDCPFAMQAMEWWIREDLAVGGPEPWDVPVGHPDFQVPVKEHWTGEAVPVWIVSLQGVLTALGDGIVTIGELEALQPIEGTATRFHAVVQNSTLFNSMPSQDPSHSFSLISGVLEDGRSFRHYFQERGGQFNHAEFVIE